MPSSPAEQNNAKHITYLPVLKQCGHNCCPSSVSKCCPCSDNRPVLEENRYPCYKDGEGWVNEESRDAGYCPVCNPKNFDAWEKKIAKERARKEERREMLAKKELEAGQLKEEDRNRAVSLAADQTQWQGISSQSTKTQFTYSSGDCYSGEMKGGEPHGSGRMVYAAGEMYSGQWREGMHHGRGDKNWGDGITYSGEWQDNMMHGVGHYVMADGTEVTGVFAEDEFVE